MRDQGSLNLEVRMGRWQGKFDECVNSQPAEPATKCIQDAADLAARGGDIGAGLAMLRLGVEVNPYLTGKCHDATHRIGKEAIERGASLAEVYAVSFPDCRFGFYHGALEAHSGGLSLAELSDQLPELCAPFGDEASAATGECVHVLGHFVFDRVQPDVETGVRTCELIPSERLQGRCVDGLLMQAIDLVRPAVEDPGSERRELLKTIWGEGRDEQRERVLSICSSTKEGTITYTCYTNASQALAVLWIRDYPAVHAFCSALETSWKQPCYEGIAASGFTSLDWDIEKIAEACHAGESPETAYCMQTLAFTFALQGSKEQSASVCYLAKPHEAQACAEGRERGIAVRGQIAGEVGGNDYSIYSQ
jgi:hypothetical protein